MTEQSREFEVTAATTEEAIETGLADLGLSIDDVEVEIVDDGSKGFLGLGTRPSKVKFVVKPGIALPEKLIQQAEQKKQPVQEAEKQLFSAEDPTLQVARETVSELLEQMKIAAQVTSTFIEDNQGEEQEGVLVEITGSDLSILIGRKSETLNSLQYVASLIVGKRLERWVPLTIDVEGYRGRRERQLTQLALRMAEQAISTGRRQTLEPMPANERRIIHLALRDHPQVTTESTGEEPNRKLTIILKK